MADGDLSAQFTLQPGWQYAPALDEVAALLRARLYVNGQQHDTFDDETRPNAAQAAALVTTASSYVRSRAGEDIPEALWAVASHVTSLRAAMLIEMSYSPEQTTGDESIFQNLSTLFDQGLAGLLDALADQALGGDHRVGMIGVTSPTLAAYQDVTGIDLNEFLLGRPS